jgi:hypothetical protein
MAGTVNTCTGTGTPFHVINKVTAQDNAWMYYPIPF